MFVKLNICYCLAVGRVVLLIFRPSSFPSPLSLFVPSNMSHSGDSSRSPSLYKWYGRTQTTTFWGPPSFREPPLWIQVPAAGIYFDPLLSLSFAFLLPFFYIYFLRNKTLMNGAAGRESNTRCLQNCDLRDWYSTLKIGERQQRYPPPPLRFS